MVETLASRPNKVRTGHPIECWTESPKTLGRATRRREHFPLDASLLNELSFSNFPLLYSSRSGVLCHPKPDA
jgi:hypothetical protein